MTSVLIATFLRTNKEKCRVHLHCKHWNCLRCLFQFSKFYLLNQKLEDGTFALTLTKCSFWRDGFQLYSILSVKPCLTLTKTWKWFMLKLITFELLHKSISAYLNFLSCLGSDWLVRVFPNETVTFCTLHKCLSRFIDVLEL